MHSRFLPTAALAVLALAAPLPAQPHAAWSGARQALVVTTASWDATAARVRLWERTVPGGAWRPASETMEAVVGRAGLGWGLGLHPAAEGGPVKREGDGRAPAGVFRLSLAFGYAPADSVGAVRLPYRQATPASRCVDDPASRAYNRWVEADAVAARDWTSHEVMRRPDDLYRLGVWVDHNAGAPVPGAGSCIFLHLRAGPQVPTVGCTAFAAADLESLLRRLDGAAAPVLVQLPSAEYHRLRTPWGLP